ncbi:hypothetical protein MNBD_DELTA02-174 [hydrothermal vent metagenome]|uniref:Mce/MlaD domain-containing protein n=1 Tax=hydrothermal vent metagenome TaxID=652676 RepID=A0A3B0UYG0_9ZZZZ
MIKLTPETKVGLFVIVGIALLVIMSLKLGGVDIASDEGYELKMRLDNAIGLDPGAAITIAGVEVGNVKSIALEGSKALITIKVRSGVEVMRNYTVALKTSGLLGEKYLALIPGIKPAPLLTDGDEIKSIAAYSDMDRLITALSDVAVDIKKITGSLGDVLGGKDNQASLGSIIKNLQEITSSVNSIVAENDVRFTTVMKNMESFSASLKDITEMLAANKGNFNATMKNVSEAMATLNKIAPNVNSTVSSISKIAKRIERGEGTIGKLINDDETHTNINQALTGINKFINKADRFRTYISFRSEFLFDESDTKNYASLRLQPKPGKYYLIEVIDDPRGHRTTSKRTKVINGQTTRAKVTTTDDDVTFSVQIAKRLSDLTLRGGMIESTGGVGLDYHLFKDKLKLTFEAYDFDSDRATHLKSGLSFALNRYFFLTAGYDDFISDAGLESAYAGVGFRFEDKDLKFLFSIMPSVNF